MKRQHANRIRKGFRPQVASLEARNLLSHSGLSPHAGRTRPPWSSTRSHIPGRSR